MKQKYVPLSKRSKREQKKYHKTQRRDWDGLNPVTRTLPNPKAYDRKKSGHRCDNEPCPDFFAEMSKFALRFTYFQDAAAHGCINAVCEK